MPGCRLGRGPRLTNNVLILLACAGCLGLPAGAAAQNPHLVVYEGRQGPGAGKHIVLLAGDHEYRGEETLPALARILARRYGFTCSVFFTTDPRPGSSNPAAPTSPGSRRSRRPTCSSCFCDSRIFQTTRCSTSPTTWIAEAR